MGTRVARADLIAIIAENRAAVQQIARYPKCAISVEARPTLDSHAPGNQIDRSAQVGERKVARRAWRTGQSLLTAPLIERRGHACRVHACGWRRKCIDARVTVSMVDNVEELRLTVL